MTLGAIQAFPCVFRVAEIHPERLRGFRSARRASLQVACRARRYILLAGTAARTMTLETGRVRACPRWD